MSSIITSTLSWMKANVGRSSYMNYAHRHHDVDGYLRLLQTKLWLMNRPESQRQQPIHELLRQSPASMHNPYTLQPMAWDEKEGSLVFEGREVANFNPTKTKQFKTKLNMNADSTKK